MFIGLFEPFAPYTLSVIVGGWKSFTAREINMHINSHGPLWQENYWDRYIRNKAHYLKVVEYILKNPLKAGLVDDLKDWPWLYLIQSSHSNQEQIRNIEA